MFAMEVCVAPQKGRRISLVLGSGGARGLAHIGIIQELENAAYEIRSISGASIGALIGGVYAAGKLDQLEKWMRAFTRMDIFNLLDINWGEGGLIKGDRLIETLTGLIGDRNIEDLPIDFTAVAADIVQEKELWINSGSLFQAIRASVSLPLFLKPLHYKDAVLIDGGVLNPVPIGPTFNDRTDITIAVNLGGVPKIQSEETEGAVDLETSVDSELSKSISDFIKLFSDNKKAAKKPEVGLFEVANRAFDTMQNALARQKLAAYPPDYLIEIPRNACEMMDFHKADEMIELGRAKARECIAQAEANSALN